MSQPFKRGDIVQHEDGSIYVVAKRRQELVICNAIVECDERYRGKSPLKLVARSLTKLGHTQLDKLGKC